MFVVVLHQLLTLLIFFRFSIEGSGSSMIEMRTGQSVTLPCTIVPPSALQSVRIQWTKNGQSISDSRYVLKSSDDLYTS